MNKSIELPKLKPHYIYADYLQGLVHVVTQFGARYDVAKYCIDGFGIDLCSGLLQKGQEKYPVVEVGVLIAS